MPLVTPSSAHVQGISFTVPLVTLSSVHVQGISFTVPLVTPSRNFPADADSLYDDAAVLRDMIKGTG